MCTRYQRNSARITQTFTAIVDFVDALNAASKGTNANDDSIHTGAVVSGLVSMLDDFMGWVDEIPPIEQPMRFGNKAFRTWYTKVVDAAPAAVRTAVGATGDVAAPAENMAEAAGYLCDSFGNATRIDYGTGHETNFILFLLTLHRTPLPQAPAPEGAAAAEGEGAGGSSAQDPTTSLCLGAADLPAVALRVFPHYLRLCRKVQLTYKLEPAGSHGVWSLDDYQMLPFFLGSAQLIGQGAIAPPDVLGESVRAAAGTAWMYLEAVQYVTQVKHGAPFAEHSPLLHDLTRLPTWERVNVNMRRMYLKEVLGKRVVMTHTQFGTVLPCTWTHSTPGAGRAAPTNPAGHAGVMGVAPWASAAAVPLPSTMGVAPWAQKPTTATE